jgi:hypothetical protein
MLLMVRVRSGSGPPDAVWLRGKEQATRLEFAGGLSAKILPGLSLYAQAGYQIAVNGETGVSCSSVALLPRSKTSSCGMRAATAFLS